MAALLLREDLAAIVAEAEDTLVKAGRTDQRAVVAAFTTAAMNAIQHRVGLHLGELQVAQQRTQRSSDSTAELLADFDRRLSALEKAR